MLASPSDRDVPPSIDLEFCRAGETARKAKRLLDDAMRSIDCDGVGLWVFSKDNQKLTVALNVARNKRVVEGLEVEIRGSLVGLVAMTGEGICVGPDANYNPEVAKKLEVRTFAMVAAAVVVGYDVCGVLSAVNQYGATEKTFTHEHLKAVQWMAYLLGLILADCRRSD